MDNNLIFGIDFVRIHYNLGEISSQIIEWKFVAPFDFLEINLSLFLH